MRTYLRRAEAANRLHISTTAFKTLVAEGKNQIRAVARRAEGV